MHIKPYILGFISTDVRTALENWAEHAQSAELSQSKTSELRRDFLLL
jgi:hypothetical protein